MYFVTKKKRKIITQYDSNADTWCFRYSKCHIFNCNDANNYHIWSVHNGYDLEKKIDLWEIDVMAKKFITFFILFML